MTGVRAGNVRIATGPVAWGVDFADSPGNPPWESVLDDIEESGVGALELGPVGYLPEDPEALRGALTTRGLTSVGSFIFDDLHDPSKLADVLATAERACATIASSGGSMFVIIDRPDHVRVATAGRSGAAPRLDGPRWQAMIETIATVAEVGRRHGLRPVVHPHAGGYIEFIDEIERLVADTDLDLCLDTGHLAYAGIDAGWAIRRFASRLGYVHFKDIRRERIDRVRADAMTFWDAIADGVFCPIGEGVVDITDVLSALDEAGYRGFATIEQDRVPGSGTPLEDLRRSLAVIESANQRRQALTAEIRGTA